MKQVMPDQPVVESDVIARTEGLSTDGLMLVVDAAVEHIRKYDELSKCARDISVDSPGGGQDQLTRADLLNTRAKLYRDADMHFAIAISTGEILDKVVPFSNGDIWSVEIQRCAAQPTTT